MTTQTEKFIIKAKAIHGEKYDYFKTDYVHSAKHVVIICNKHGEFLQKPDHHLRGSGCRKCSDENYSNTMSFTTEKFIELSKNKFPDIFDYSKVVYKNKRTSVILICSIHNNEFVIFPQNHLRQLNGGCELCLKTHITSTRTKTQEKFIEECNNIHNFKYDYSSTMYTHCFLKIIIICNVHGKFKQQARSHMNGAGCPCCTTYKNENECRQIIEKLTGNQFIKERPKFLNKLEYDGYCDDLKIAFEYNGEQHYEYIPFFHSGKRANLEKQKKHDLLKKELSHNNGVFLIVIPYHTEDKESFISSQLELCQFLRICL